MKVSNPLWKEHLADQIAPQLARELDIFDNEVTLKKNGKIDDKVFAETRLRRGAYGQRYDNGQRHDGVETRKLVYPVRRTQKVLATLWDAPGYAAHQDSVRRPERASARSVSRTRGRVFRLHRATSRPGRTSNSTTSTSKIRRRSCGVWLRSASRPAKPAATPFGM